MQGTDDPAQTIIESPSIRLVHECRSILQISQAQDDHPAWIDAKWIGVSIVFGRPVRDDRTGRGRDKHPPAEPIRNCAGSSHAIERLCTVIGNSLCNPSFNVDPLRRTARFRSRCSGGFTNDPGTQRGSSAFTVRKPSQFDRSDVRTHLFVQKLHYSSQLAGDHVGNEHQFDAPRDKVAFYLLPEIIGIVIADKIGKK